MDKLKGGETNNEGLAEGFKGRVLKRTKQSNAPGYIYRRVLITVRSPCGVRIVCGGGGCA